MPDPIILRRFFLCSGELVNEDKLYKFPLAHILGELRLRMDRKTNRTVGMLAVYRESMPTVDVPMIKPRISNFTFHSPNVLCSLCDQAPRWEINHSAFMVLMAHYDVYTLEDG